MNTLSSFLNVCMLSCCFCSHFSPFLPIPHQTSCHLPVIFLELISDSPSSHLTMPSLFSAVVELPMRKSSDIPIKKPLPELQHHNDWPNVAGVRSSEPLECHGAIRRIKLTCHSSRRRMRSKLPSNWKLKGPFLRMLLAYSTEQAPAIIKWIQKPAKE